MEERCSQFQRVLRVFYGRGGSAAQLSTWTSDHVMEAVHVIMNQKAGARYNLQKPSSSDPLLPAWPHLPEVSCPAPKPATSAGEQVFKM